MQKANDFARTTARRTSSRRMASTTLVAEQFLDTSTERARKHTRDAVKDDSKGKKPRRAGPDSQDTESATDGPRRGDSSGRGASARGSPNANKSFTSASEVVDFFIGKYPLPARPVKLSPLSQTERQELEKALEFETGQEGWREDWSGNLAYSDHDILNPNVKGRGKQSFRQSLLLWAENSNESRRLLHNLLRFVYNMPKTPPQARLILSAASPSSHSEMQDAIRRISYDPIVLSQDGWTTSKSEEPVGATGGPFLVGEMIRWQSEDAYVIAYVHDNELGDLWKAVWVEQENFATFDLEAEELIDAREKWKRRNNAQGNTAYYSRKSSRFAVSEDFTVKGVEYGIVLASSISKGARPGVFWPARVMHASESSGSSAQAKRSSARQKVDVVFLSPYWDSRDVAFSRGRRVEGLSASDDSAFHSGDLFQIELIEATHEMIKEYPFDPAKGLDIEQLRMSFRFTGLPKGVFQRFVDSHRLALALKAYAKVNLKTNISATELASARLFETHQMALKAPLFPTTVLHLPFSFILSELPSLKKNASGVDSSNEPILQLATILNAMKPPHCWNTTSREPLLPDTPLSAKRSENGFLPASIGWLASLQEAKDTSGSLDIHAFVSDLPGLKDVLSRASSAPGISALVADVSNLLSSLKSEVEGGNDRRGRISTLTRSWSCVKRHGEEAISSVLLDNSERTLAEWRRAAERIYKYLTEELSFDGVGNGVSLVLTDSRCNGHKTNGACFERSVRLPAALKGAKLAGAGSTESLQLISHVSDECVRLVENDLLVKTHSTSYIKRMKNRCAAAATDDEVLQLTDDSDGNGGEDTLGSRGTWTAALCGVASAVSAVNKIVRGECVNAFCATRPPGHHAGRTLHPMKAVSNGFCILNSAACAAIHATTPLSEGGMGLSRVCVFDFDVHHGNGTQDILCSTYDPRYLYVSIHAGGAQVNGVVLDDDPDHELHDLASNPKSGGIYPGHCGDTSPHKGVLNIPLGSKVTSQAVGSALVGRVVPAVDAFSPDLIILSAGFDAHKHDPMGLGGLSAEDFGHITEVACQLALKSCSGRLLSILEGGYGVPCCRPQEDTFLPKAPGASVEQTKPFSSGAVEALEESKPASPTQRTVEESKPAAPSQQTGPPASSPPTQVPIVSQQDDATMKKMDPSEAMSLADTGSGEKQSQASTSALDILAADDSMETPSNTTVAIAPPPAQPKQTRVRPQPSKLLDLGSDLPDDMDDQVPYALQRRLEKCHAEGFVECVKEHVGALARCNKRRQM